MPLPQRALPTSIAASCRAFPITAVQAEIVSVLDDLKSPWLRPAIPACSPRRHRFRARIMDPVRRVAAGIWPGVAIVPTMSTGATDGRFLNASGVPTYGLSGMFHDAEGSRAHGLNERIRVSSLMNGRRFLYEVVKLYANEP